MDPASTKPASVELDYASPRRRRVIRSLIYSVFCVVVAFLAIQYALPPVKQHINAWRLESRLTPAVPSSLVVFDSTQPIVTSAERAWREFESSALPTRSGTGIVAILRRTNAQGEDRLIILGIGSGISHDTVSAITCITRTPTTLTQVGRELWSDIAFSIDANANPLLIYAPQPDPADRSHFTIAYTRGSDSHILDGYLKSDETVLIELRPPVPIAP